MVRQKLGWATKRLQMHLKASPTSDPGCSSVDPRSSWPAACPPLPQLSVPLLTVQHTGRPCVPCLTFATSTFSPRPLCSLQSSNARLHSQSSDCRSGQGSRVAASSPLQLRPFSPDSSDCPSQDDGDQPLVYSFGCQFSIFYVSVRWFEQ